jgi:hypothetical protein
MPRPMDHSRPNTSTVDCRGDDHPSTSPCRSYPLLDVDSCIGHGVVIAAPVPEASAVAFGMWGCGESAATALTNVAAHR